MTSEPAIDLGRDALQVAPDLLGAVLVHAGVAVELTEVEAYRGLDDPASHAFRGPTARTRVMFGPASHLYVYLSYGIHLAANIVCDADGTAGAVLLRSGRVVGGSELARERRGASRRTGSAPVPDAQLARGPGCVGQALALSLTDSGAELRQAGPFRPGDETRAGEGFVLHAPDPSHPLRRVATGGRVGVSQAADHPWRFWIEGDATVSAYQRSRRAAPPESP